MAVIKRKKKYNPNKLLEQAKAKTGQFHDLYMYYDNNLVDKITAQWKSQYPKVDLPIKMLYPHVAGDLMIAVQNRGIDLVQKWEVRMIFSLLHVETQATEEVELSFDLPVMHITEINNKKSDIKIIRDSGFKSRWKGLDAEIYDAIKPLEAEGFVCLQQMAEVKTTAKFLTVADYLAFRYEQLVKSRTKTTIKHAVSVPDMDLCA